MRRFLTLVPALLGFLLPVRLFAQPEINTAVMQVALNHVRGQIGPGKVYLDPENTLRPDSGQSRRTTEEKRTVAGTLGLELKSRSEV